MNENTQDLSELLTQKLGQSVKNKAGQTILNEEGQPMTTLEAIAMTIVQNAMKGDASYIMLVRSLTKKKSTEEEKAKAQEEYERKIEGYKNQIISELKRDGLWYEQMFDVEQLAKILCIADNIEAEMHSPDYDDLVAEIRRDGTTAYHLNPLHERWDYLQKQITSCKDRMYAEAYKKKRQGKMTADIEF